MAKILLVEDDNNLREIYEARLMAEGYDIVSARDGEEALTVAMKEKPDLIISDVMMPKISGFDMLDILRTTEETKNAKVIMMTALSQAEDKARAEKLGADRYLVKSQVTLEDVAKVAKQVLDGEPAPAQGAQAQPSSEAPTPVPAPIQPASEPPAEEPAAAPAQPAVQPSQDQPTQTQQPAAPTASAQPEEPTPQPRTPAPAADDATTQTSSTDDADDSSQPSPASAGETRKKVIEPINNLKEDPEAKLKALLEKEKQREQMAQTVHETLDKAKPPVSTEPGVDANTSEAPKSAPGEASKPDGPDPNSIAL